MGAPLEALGRDQDGLDGSSVDPGRAARPQPPSVVKTGGNMAWPSYITGPERGWPRGWTVTRPPIKSKFVSSRGLEAGAVSLRRGEGEVRIIGRVAGFDVHRGGDEISRATIKAWIIYCRDESRFCAGISVLLLGPFFRWMGGGVSLVDGGGNIDTLGHAAGVLELDLGIGFW